MTYATQSPAAGLSGSIAGFLGNLRASIARSIARSVAYRRTRDELDAMTDRELADIGIARFMIGDIARQAAKLA